MTDRPDPRKVINPETGRPLSEERLSVWDRRSVPEDEFDQSETNTVSTKRGSDHVRGGRAALVDGSSKRTPEEIADEMMELLFGE